MDLMTIWKQVRGEVALPEPAYVRSTPPQFYKDDWAYQKLFSANQMRAIATPDPETLKRFAEAVAEEAVGRTAARCREMAMWPQGIDDEQAYYGRMFAEFIDREFGAAIRRHVKGK